MPTGVLQDGKRRTHHCACRARTETSFSFGDDASKLGDYAWSSENNPRSHFAERVGQKKANPWGLFDMHGNVWEWCRDNYTEKLPGGRDPEVNREEKTPGSGRVIRGGSWYLRRALAGPTLPQIPLRLRGLA